MITVKSDGPVVQSVGEGYFNISVSEIGIDVLTTKSGLIVNFHENSTNCHLRIYPARNRISDIIEIFLHIPPKRINVESSIIVKHEPHRDPDFSVGTAFGIQLEPS